MTAFSILPVLVYDATYPGTVTLSEEQLQKLQDGYIDSNGVSVSTGTTISFICELYNRYQISSIKYYFSGAGSITIQTSQNKDVWDTHTTSSQVGYIEAVDFSSFIDWPKYVRVIHSATEASQAFEIQVINKDEEHGYWIDGSLDELDVDSSAGSEPSEVQIFNTSRTTRDFYCFLDIGTSANDAADISLSLEESGTYYGRYEKGLKLSRDYAWTNGVLSGVVVSGTSLRLDPASGTGYYYSPVLDVNGLDPLRIFWEHEDSANTNIDFDDQNDSESTIKYRLYDKAPEAPWSAGQSPNTTDPVWGSLSGTLEYSYVPNNTILPVNAGQYRYAQVVVKFNSDIIGDTSILSSLGVEEALKVSGVESNSYKSIYAKTDISSYSVGDYVNVLTFFIE